ncbi:MAG: nucleotide exchange factor GrpE [Planctomycetota bacterium]|jgi:molecular chaperone GrpE
MTKKKRKPDESDTQPKPRSPEAAPAAETAEEKPMSLEAERDDLLARLQRVSADYVNFQKRVQRESGESRQFAHAELIKALLPVLDDMERALEAARDNHGEDDPFFQGMQLVHDKALETLGKFGLTVIDAVGKPFDPDRHAAMMQHPTTDHPPQTVLTEVQRGYVFGDRTLRPSGVVVSVEPPTESEEQPAEDQQHDEETPDQPEE